MINISSPTISHEDIKAVVRVLESGHLTQGSVLAEFEQKFADYCGVKYAIAVNSGTAALHAALAAIHIDEGDEVITTPFTFVATINAILMQRAMPKFVDIELDDYMMSPQSLEKNISKKTKAVITVDLYGNTSKYNELLKITNSFKIPVVEDACQAIGATYGKKKAGSLTTVGAFSLYATKNITTGEGGMITTNSREIDRFCREFRSHGQEIGHRYSYKRFGYNYRLPDILAALGASQLERTENITNKRIENAKKYIQLLTDIPGIVLPKIHEKNRHVFHQFTIRVTQNSKISRDRLQSVLENNGVSCGVYYPRPLHLYPIFSSKFGWKKGDFPNAESAADEVLSLPVHPNMSEKQIEYVSNIIRTYAE